MNSELGIILQARTGSTRLPNKMVMPFYKDRTIPQILIERISKAYPELPIILATTTHEIDDDLVSSVSNLNCDIFRGSENNVLNRFIEAANKHNFKHVIRVCADNPFIDISLIDTLIQNWKSDYDYLSFKINGKPSMKIGLGLFTEIVSLNALEATSIQTSEKLYLEHVTNFIYRDGSPFKVNWVTPPQVILMNDGLRLTVDTKEDFEVAQKIFLQLQESEVTWGFEEIITFVNAHDELIRKMDIQKNHEKNAK